MRPRALVPLVLALGLLGGAPASGQGSAAVGGDPVDAPVDVAVFDFELIDTSLDGEMLGPQEAEARRLAALGEALRAAYAGAEGFRVVDMGPLREPASQQSLQNCGGCAGTFAREFGADLAVTGTVQKVSNLILNINVYIEDAGGAEQAFSADIRGNTDESWRRGLDWLIRNRLGLAP